MGPFLRRSSSDQNVDAQEESCSHIRAPLPRGSYGGQKRYPCSKTSRTRSNSQLAGHQSLDQPQVSWLCKGTVCMEALLLVFDQRRHWIPSQLPSFAPRDCPHHTQKAIQT